MKNLPTKIVLLALGFFVGLLAFEGFLRLLHWVESNRGGGSSYAGMESRGLDLTKNEENLKALYRYDQLLGWKLSPGASVIQLHQDFKTSYSMNNEGFRDDVDYAARKKPGKKRIMIFGDSFAFGVGVPNKKTFSKILEAESSGKYEVLNFGVSGYDPGQYLLSLKEDGLKYNPDIVVYAIYLGNDIIDLGLDHLSQGDKYKPYFTIENGNFILQNVPVPTEKATYGEDTRVKNSFIKFFISQTYNFETAKMVKNVLRDKVYKPMIKLGLLKDISDYNYELSLLKSILEDAKEITDKRGIRFLIMIIPSNHSAGGYAAYLEDGFDEKIKSMVGELGIPLVDLVSDLSLGWDKYYFSHEGHFNEEGHEVAAGRLWGAIANDK